MKRILSCLLAVFLIAAALSACTNQTPATDTSAKLNIVATTFPPYDWVRQILGEKSKEVELTLLLDDGVDLHSYQPTMEDIAKISACDMFVYVGGESDTWVHDALETATNKNMVVVNMLDILGDKVKEEEIVEGMEHEEIEPEAVDEPGDSEEHEMDEHVWLSLKNTQMICSHLSKELAALDVQNSSVYASNAASYNAKLEQLDAAYQSTVDGAFAKTLLFGDRFPFRYLADDYGLSYYAAFSGCSAETEASFETIVFLAGKVDELTLKSVMVIDGSGQSIARTIIENTIAKNQNILVLNSMQSVTAQDVSSGTTYLSVMESNLEVLKEALS